MVSKAIKSRLQFKKELSEMQKERLSICQKCPSNSDNVLEKSWKDNFWILLNKLANKIFGVNPESEAICTQCFCQLIHKSSQEDEKCPQEKWK